MNMNRSFWIAFAAAAALWSTGAQSTVKNVENAYEITVSQMLLPDAANGQVIIRRCSSCAAVLLRTDAATAYQLGARFKPVSLADFRAAAKKDGNQMVVVYYRLDSKVVTRMVLAVAG
jgi:hypothetical protein